LEKFEAFETKAAVLRCRICSMSIKRYYGSVWSHLNKDHGVSLFDYQVRKAPYISKLLKCKENYFLQR
jgi:hypothetical protein